MTADPSIEGGITDAASRWVTARDAGTMTDADQRALAQWLAADPRHAAAFAMAERFWADLGGGAVKTALRERYPGMEGRAVRADRRGAGRWPRPSRRWTAPALAAGLALAALVDIGDWPTRWRADAATATGERRTVSLADGSIVLLDTDSAIAVDYAAGHRIVRLLKGKAAFTVAPDTTRPFSVEAGGGRTTALGTRFVVARDGAETGVTVTEHHVRVDWPGPPDAQRIVAEGWATYYGPGGIAPAHAVDTVAATAWTRGTLLFVDRPLAEVVTELNRYHPGHLHVLGADLGARRVSGGFPTDDPVAAIDMVQRNLGLRSMRVTDRLILLYR